MNIKSKNTLIHLAAVIVMLAASCIYFSPVLSGEIVIQGDIQKSDAMAHAQRMVADSTGTIPNWNPSMFSGMPGYQTAVEKPKTTLVPLKDLLTLRPLGIASKNAIDVAVVE